MNLVEYHFVDLIHKFLRNNSHNARFPYFFEEMGYQQKDNIAAIEITESLIKFHLKQGDADKRALLHTLSSRDNN